MTLKRSGINLVVGNLGNFLSALGRVTTAYSTMGKAADNARNSVERLARYSEMAAKREETSQLRVTNAIKMAQNALIKLGRQRQIYTEQLARQDITNEEILYQEDQLTIAANNYTNALNHVLISLRDVNNAQIKSVQASIDQATAQEKLNSILSSVAPNLAGAYLNMQQLAGALGVSVFAIGAVVAAFGALKTAINLARAAWNAFINFIRWSYSTVLNVINGIINAFKGIVNIFSRITAPIRNFFGNIFQLAGGIALYDILRKVTAGFRNLIGEVFNAVAAFQQLQIKFETIAARDYAHQFGVPMAEAFKNTGNAAMEMLEWIKKLAVVTPYSVQDIAQVSALANAMGLTTSKTKELVSATMNFTAAMGLESDRMWNIIYNMGQMIQRGRLTGEEFRDLSRNFVPIYDILGKMAEKTEMTTDEFREFAFQGGVPVMDFLNEFIRRAEEDFPDAMEKMARTWTGVTNNIKDFLQAYIGLDILGPTMNKFTKMVAAQLDALLGSKDFAISIKYIGQALALAFDVITPAVDKFMAAMKEVLYVVGILVPEAYSKTGATARVLGQELGEAGEKFTWVSTNVKRFAVALVGMSILIRDAIDKIAEKIKKWASDTDFTFQDLARKAFQWGVKFIQALAQGISTAITILTAVIKTIASILSYWFAPGSPPNIAKDIDKWGKYMIDQWLGGFMLADFSIFNDIANMVENYLRSFTERIGEKSVLEKIIGSRKQIAAAVAAVRAGTLSVAEAVNKVVKATGIASSQFKTYISTMFQIEDVSRRIKEAQNELNAVTERYDAILDGLNAQLEEITTVYDENVQLRKIEEALATGLLTKEEEERLLNEKNAILLRRQIRDTEAQRDAEVKAIEDKIKALEEEEAALKDQLETARLYLEAQIKQNQLIEEQIKLLERLAEASKAAGDASATTEQEVTPEDMGGIGAGGFELPNFNLETLLKDADKWASEMREKLNYAFQPLYELFGGKEGEKAGGNLGPTEKVGVFSQLKLAFDDLKTSLEPLTIAWGNLMTRLQEAGPLTGEGSTLWKVFDFLKNAGVAAKDFYDAVMAYLIPPFDAFSEKWPSVRTNLSEMGVSLGNLWTAVKTFFENIGGVKIEGSFLEWIASEVVADGISFVANSITVLADAFSVLFKIINGSLDAINTIKDFLTTLKESGPIGGGIAEAAELTATGISGGPGAFLETLFKKAIGFIDEKVPAIGEAWERIREKTNEVWDNIVSDLVGQSIIPDLMQSIYDIISTRIDDVLKVWEDKWGLFKDDIDTFSTDVKALIDGALTDLSLFFTTQLTTSWSTFYYTIGLRMYSLFKDINTQIGEFLIPYLETLVTYWRDEFVPAVGETSAVIESHHSVLTKLVSDVISLRNAFEQAAGVLEHLVELLVQLKSKTVTITIYYKMVAQGGKGKQSGGDVKAGTPYVVGEKQPEVFVPRSDGYIYSSLAKYRSVISNAMANSRINAAPVAGNIIHGDMVVNNETYIEVNPTYKHVEQPSGIFHDITAALVAARR